jgi:hypothetical protein
MLPKTAWDQIAQQNLAFFAPAPERDSDFRVARAFSQNLNITDKSRLAFFAPRNQNGFGFPPGAAL